MKTPFTLGLFCIYNGYTGDEHIVNNSNYIPLKTPQFWRATIALSIGAFLVFSNLHMTQPLLPLFTNEFGVSPATASLSISLVTITLSLFLLVFGPISDAIGRKNVMAVGLFFSSIISILIFFSQSFAMLLVLRTLQGIFLAGLPAIAYAYIGEEFEKHSIGVVIGIYISGNSLGGMGGRIISGFVADLWGWKYSFLVMGVIGLISFGLFMLLLPSCKHFCKRRFSFKKALQEIFVNWKNPILRQAYYVAAIIYFIFLGVFNYIGYHLHAAPYLLSTSFIGLLYISYLAGTFSSTLSGKLDGILTIPKRILLGLLTILVGLILLLASPLWVILIGLTVVVFGFFFTHAASSSWVSLHAKEAKASASALYLLSYYMGGSLGSTLLGFVWEPLGWTAVIAVTILFSILAMLTVRTMKYSEATTNKALSINE